MSHIHSAAVLGAGTMGAQIAAHLANSGIPVLLLDIDSNKAKEGLLRAQKLKPDPFFTREGSSLITTGGFDENIGTLHQYDWIIEAAVERIDVKRQLIAKIEMARGRHSIVSSNTSGIPISSIAKGRSEDFRRHWLGTHFFNPPRYLQLLEVIPTSDTNESVVETIRNLGDHSLGKGVVIAKDTPGFIGNRIGLHGVMAVLRLLVNGTFTIEEIDSINGTMIGRPKSATFRTLDITGLDVVSHVAQNLAEQMDNDYERAMFTIPPLIEDMITRGWIGEKTGKGFYKKEKSSEGNQILTLDLETMNYRERRSPQFSSLEAVQAIENIPERIRTLFLSPDRVGQFLRDTLGRTLVYAAEVAPAIAHSIDDVDRAMRWGFGWQLGPFEIWDAIGVDEVLESCCISDPPPLIQDLGPTRRFRAGIIEPTSTQLQLLLQAKNGGTKDDTSIVQSKPGSSLVDLGNGVLALEFHSKMNIIGGETIAMLNAGIEEAERNYEALVIGNEATTFSAGANLMLVLLEAQDQNWDEIDLMVRSFQLAVINLRYSNIPVVVAPAGVAFGGGCEIILHSDRVQAAAETYIGQVEVGVGLVPAGGGTKELLVRAIEQKAEGFENLLPSVRKAFELIGYGKVSSSAANALELGLLRKIDCITMNRERVMSDAKTKALELARSGYQPPPRRNTIPVGGDDIRAGLELGVHLAWRGGYISDHDALIGRKLAFILAGGTLPHKTQISEQHLLDLEREAFLSLCGETKTLERISHTLKTGKTLKN